MHLLMKFLKLWLVEINQLFNAIPFIAGAEAAFDFGGRGGGPLCSIFQNWNEMPVKFDWGAAVIDGFFPSSCFSAPAGASSRRFLNSFYCATVWSQLLPWFLQIVYANRAFWHSHCFLYYYSWNIQKAISEVVGFPPNIYLCVLIRFNSLHKRMTEAAEDDDIFGLFDDPAPAPAPAPAPRTDWDDTAFGCNFNSFLQFILSVWIYQIIFHWQPTFFYEMSTSVFLQNTPFPFFARARLLIQDVYFFYD